MGTSELFPNPTVKQVIFQVRFPNLFFLESRIGDIQLAVMERFPQSQLIVQRSVLIADVGPEVAVDKLAISPEAPETKKIWRFESADNVILNLQANSLDLSSTSHKSYDHAAASTRFRDVIEFVLGRFLKVVKVPIFTRVGLRYIDHCPVSQLDEGWFRSYYQTTLPLSRFDLADADLLQTTAVVRRGKLNLRFQETLKALEGKHGLILDFDGFANDVKSSATIKTTDELHKLIDGEWNRSINDGLRQFMRGQEGL